MKKLFYFFIASLLFFSMLYIMRQTPIWAICEIPGDANYDELQNAINACQEEINVRMGAHSKNKEDLADLEKNLGKLKELIKSAESQINQVEKEIFDYEVDLGYQKEIFAKRVRNYYIRSRRYSPFLLFLSSVDAVKLSRELAYRQTVADRDKGLIVNLSQDLKKLTTDKEELEANKGWLTKTKNSVAQQADFLRKEVEKVEGYFTKVESKIAELTAKQQALLAEKFASVPIPLLAYTRMNWEWSWVVTA